MNTDNTLLLNKLMLLVLSLILACLVMLVIRAFQTPLANDEAPELAEAEPPTIEVPAPTEPSPPTPARPPRRVASTNPIRATPPVQAYAPLPDSPPEPVAQPDQIVADNSTLLINSALTEVAGGGVRASTGGNSVGPGPELVGIVTLLGRPKPEIPIDLGPSCSQYNPDKVTTRHYVVSKQGGLANVFVYLKDAKPSPTTGDGPLLDQIGCMYEPYLMGVVTGQKFSIRNSDPELHNVHATPMVNREFNFGQPLQGQVSQRSFPNPEIFVRLKCDVHPWMFAYIGVVDHPFFAVSDTNGIFRFPTGFLAGNYKVSAVHVKAGELTQRVSLGEGERKALHFQFTVPSSGQPQGRVARSH